MKELVDYSSHWDNEGVERIVRTEIYILEGVHLTKVENLVNERVQLIETNDLILSNYCEINKMFEGTKENDLI